MRILLDTHVLIWWLQDNPRLNPAAAALIADPANEISVSIASFWEIAVNQRIGKLKIDLARVCACSERDGMSLLAIELPHLARLAELPQHHRDPFDHLLIAQAIEDGLALMTDDRVLRCYPVQIIDAGCRIFPVSVNSL